MTNASVTLTCAAMSFLGVQGREDRLADDTFPHTCVSAANELCRSRTGREIDLHLNVVKQLKGVTAEITKANAGCFDGIAGRSAQHPELNAEATLSICGPSTWLGAPFDSVKCSKLKLGGLPALRLAEGP